MIDPSKPLTFLLGAGASHPFNFPLGPELKQNITQDALNLHREYENQFTTALLDQFKDALRGTSHKSIDVFLEKKKQFREIGSIAIARALLPRESIQHVLPSSDWYQVLYNFLRLEDPKAPAPQVSVVTLNYERSLEAFLAGKITCDCDSDHEEQARRKLASIPIVHAHGSLGPYPEVPFSGNGGKEQVEKAAKNIRVISDNLDDSEDFQKAQEIIANSQQLVVLGFGYDQRTVSLLFKGWQQQQGSVFSSAFGLTDQKKDEVVSRIGAVHWGPLKAPAKAFLQSILPLV